jgi:anaerobic selenocysteine-containing dehydrogenase
LDAAWNMPVKTYSSCYMCAFDCPITVDSHGSEVVAIDHPGCVRATALGEQRESDKRLLHPQLRDGADDAWRTVAWSDAVSQTARRLLDIREKHGPQAVAFAVGYTKEVRPYLQRLAYGFGTSHYIAEDSCCYAAGVIAARLTFGPQYGHYLGPSRVDSVETRCRLVWSNNPKESRPPDDWHVANNVARLPTIVVDPRRTALARAAAIHLMLRPGTDGALALGFANVIFSEGLEDKEFLKHHALGLEAYKEYVQAFTPQRAGEITGVDPEKIVAAARLYATSRPAQLTISPKATTHHSNGVQNHRAVILLSAICGNLDVTGGNRPAYDRLKAKDVSRYDEIMPTLGAPMGNAQFPLFIEHYREGQAMCLADYIESGQVKAVFSIGMAITMWPNSKRLEKALHSLECFAVSDYFPNSTRDAATISFPAATSLERQSIIIGDRGRLQYRPAAVPPRGEAKGDTELVFDLAQALGLRDSFWGGDIHASFDERLQPAGVTFHDLPEDGRSIDVEVPLSEDRSYRSNGFGTPSGKVEFTSTELEKAGFDALPIYREPQWSPVSTPEIAKDYPLVLTSGGRTRNYTHSQGRLLTKLTVREPDPRVQINPVDAAARAIEEGAWVEISSPIGKIKMRAWVTDDVAPGVVQAVHGWETANINELVPDTDLDPISGFPPFGSGLCQISRRDDSINSR